MNPGNNNSNPNQSPVNEPAQQNPSSLFSEPPPQQVNPESSHFPDTRAFTEPPHQSKNKSPRGGKFRSLFSTVLLFLLAPFIALFIAAFVLQSYQVEGASMEKTLQNSDRLIVNKLPSSIARVTHHPYIPNRGDIIIFNQGGMPDSTFIQQKQLIKRVIGLPGEHVIVDEGRVTVINEEHPHGFNPDVATGYKISAPITPGNVDVIIPKNELFVLGDNRANSEDSRFFGPIKSDAIVGKLMLRILPLDKAQHY